MVLPPTPSPTCYKDYCKDPALTGLTSLGLYKTKLGEIYQSWNSDVDPLSAQELTEELVTDMSQGLPGGILVMVTDPNSTSGVAKVLHNVRIHTGRDEHCGTPFAYVGDVLDQDIEIVKFDPKVLDLCLQVNIQADVDTQIQLLTADENRELAAEPDAAAVQTPPRHILPEVGCSYRLPSWVTSWMTHREVPNKPLKSWSPRCVQWNYSTCTNHSSIISSTRPPTTRREPLPIPSNSQSVRCSPTQSK